MVKHTQTVRMFDHFVGLALKELSVHCSVFSDQSFVENPLPIIIVLEAFSGEMISGYPEVLLYADDLALNSESLQVLKGK